MLGKITEQSKLEIDSKDVDSMIILSCYSFLLDRGIKDFIGFHNMLKRVWKSYHILGYMHIVKEEVNAKISVPTNIRFYFYKCNKDIEELGEYIENSIDNNYI